MKNKLWGNCVVAGGGLCGLLSSILLADRFEKVYVIEKDDQCGGLLRSAEDYRGVVYDLGTHIPESTSIPEIDRILIGSEEEIRKHWTDLGGQRSGNYFGGRWNLENPTADARCLPRDVYERGVLELLSRTQPSRAEDIATYLVETIGPTFTSQIAAPVVKKLYGADPTTLTRASSVHYFGLSRVIALSPEVTNKLKELEVFDSKLGYHSAEDFAERLERDGTVLPTFYYPKRNVGVYFWIQHLLRQAQEKGVFILTTEYVESIKSEGKLVKAVRLGNKGVDLDCDFLLWSVPPVLALKAAGIPVPPADLQFRTANIFHFSYDKPLTNRECHYLWNWDGDYRGFRITLYPNLQPQIQPPLNNLTIESLSGPEEADGISPDEMHAELVKMGVVSEDARILSQLRQTVHNTFPVPTFEYHRTVKRNLEQLSGTFDNVFVAGRHGGKSWFHRDVAKEVYFELQERFA